MSLNAQPIKKNIEFQAFPDLKPRAIKLERPFLNWTQQQLGSLQSKSVSCDQLGIRVRATFILTLHSADGHKRNTTKV